MKNNIKGFSLPIVMIMMVVLAVMVLAAAQSFNTESRISSNDADRKMAMQVAEATLRQGEQHIEEAGLNAVGKDAEFTAACNNGLCAVDNNSQVISISERRCGNDSCLDTQGIEYNIKSDVPVSKNPRYVIEWVSIDSSEIIFRVTARAWGENSNTVVTVQSYVAAEL